MPGASYAAIATIVADLKVKGSSKGVSRQAIKATFAKQKEPPTVAQINVSLKKMVASEKLIAHKGGFKLPKPVAKPKKKVVKKASTKKKVVKKPASKKKTATKKPAAKKSTKKPATKKATTKKPAAKKPATKKAAPAKKAAPKKKPTTKKKPAAKKSVKKASAKK